MGKTLEALPGKLAPTAGTQMKGVLTSLAKQFFAASPFVLVLGVGLSTHRWHPSEHTLYQYTKAEDAIVRNYKSVVAVTEKSISFDCAPVHQVRIVLRKWGSEFKKGKLKSLPPAFQEEESESGPRLEILTAWVRTTDSGYHLVTNELKNGDLAHWQKDMPNLVAAIEAFKYSDTSTIVGSDRMEQGILAQFKVVMRHCNESTKQLLYKMAAEMTTRSRLLSSLFKKLKSNAVTYEQNQKIIMEKEGEPQSTNGGSVSMDSTGDTITQDMDNDDSYSQQSQYQLDFRVGEFIDPRIKAMSLTTGQVGQMPLPVALESALTYSNL